MSNYRRPWWLVVNRPPGLVTTVQEESSPGERVFIIRGEPVVQGLAWLTWGPVAALLVVIILAGLAIALNINEKGGALRALFVGAFLILPAVGWGLAAVLLARLSAQHLQAERQAEAEECIIRLNGEQGQLSYRTTLHPQEKEVAFADIRQARLTYPLGGSGSKVPRLALETKFGQIILLNETLGTQAQKVDLANEIQYTLKSYSDK